MRALTLLRLSVVAVFALSAAFLFPFRGLVSDLAGHFSVHYAIWGAATAAVFALGRSWPWAALSLVVASVNLAAVGRYVLVSPASASGISRPTVLVANVLTPNRRHAELVSLIEARNPTVVALIEVSQEWVEGLKPLAARYPHVFSLPRPDNFGLMVLSSVPLRQLSAEPLRRGQPPVLRATLSLGGRDVQLVQVHTMPPHSVAGLRLRDAELQSVAELLRGADGPVLLAGDLNLTPWSASFRDLLRHAGLTDPRPSFGLLPTWPQALPLLGVPIDHILSKGGVRVGKLERVGIPGSDHYGLLAELEIP